MCNDNLFVIIKFGYKRIETYCINKHSNIINTQLLTTGRWFSQGTPVPSTNKTDHFLAELLLKVALNTITLTPLSCDHSYYDSSSSVEL
jgi:hypothetical protein